MSATARAAARYLSGCLLSALTVGALYALVVSRAAELPHPLPGQPILALWICFYFLVPTLAWALLRLAVRAAVRGAPPAVGEAMHEGLVVSALVLGLSILGFDFAVGLSLFPVERARTGLRWVWEDVGILSLLGVTSALGFRFVRQLRSARGMVRAAFLLLFLNGAAGALSLALRPSAHRLPSTPVARAPSSARVILVGLDGATFRLLDPLMKAGMLPQLQGQLTQGLRATLRSRARAQSPVEWTTLFTGRPPQEHGIWGYVVTDFPGTQVQVRTTLGKSGRWLYPFYSLAALFQVTGLGDAVPPTSDYRRADALWELVSAFGGHSVSLNAFATYPTKEDSGGSVVVSDAYFGDWMWVKSRRTVGPASVTPRALRAELDREVIPPESFDPEHLRAWAPFDESDRARLRLSLRDPKGLADPLAHLRWGAAIQENVFHLAFARFADQKPELLALQDSMTDDTSHFFARFRFPEGLHSVDPVLSKKWGPVMDSEALRLDALLGPLLFRAGPDTAVVIVSDHGFQVLEDGPISDLAHDDAGVFMAFGGPFRGGGVIADDLTLLDVTPTLLHVMGYPVPAGLKGRVREELLTKEFREGHPVKRLP